MQAIGRVPFAEGATDALGLALGTSSAEARALIAEDDGRVAGVGVFGEIAGASGAAKLHLIAVAPELRGRGVAAALIIAITHTLRAEGARLLLAELPDVPALGASIDFLCSCGFQEESRVTDFCEDGVALVFFRMDLTA